MAIKVDYSKCYNNNDRNIGKTNAINSITININNLQENNQEESMVQERNLVNEEFYITDYDPSSVYNPWFPSFSSNIGKYQKLRSWFYTTLTLTLSYDDFEGLRDASVISITENDIKKTGNKKIVNTTTLYLKDVNENKPLYPDSFYSDATIIPIVSEKSSEDANELTYQEALDEINKQYSFSGSKMGDSNSSYTVTKYDNYLVIEIRLLSKVQIYQASLDVVLWDEIQAVYEYDTAAITIKYTAPDVTVETNEVNYGDSVGNSMSFDSILFVDGNTQAGIDYSSMFANSVLDEFRSGKNILSLTLPVGNFEIDYNTKDILSINDECYVEIPKSKDWITIADNFGFESSDSPVPHVFTVNGLSNGYRTNFTGRIYWNIYNTSYVDFSDSEFPLVMASTSIVNDEIEVTHRYIFSIIENGIMVTSESDNPDISPPYADIFGLHCENCVIKQYKTISIPLDTDEYGNSQLYKTIYTNLSYTDGFLLEDVKLEPIYNNEQNSIFTHTNNIITGIKDEYKSSTNILNIPAKIDDDYITEIGANFVKENYNIEKITIPYSVSKIGSGAFSNTEGIKTPIDLPDSLVEIDDYAFNFSNISGDLIIPEGVTKIGNYCFAECKKLDGVLSIPSTYKFPSSDGDYQFYNVSNLKRIVIYSDAIQTNFDITAFNNTGSCDIYVLDELIDTFKQKMPDVNPDRIKSINSMT